MRSGAGRIIAASGVGRTPTGSSGRPSLVHDAGLSLERIGDIVGHGSTYVTDRYSNLLAGHEQEATRTLDEYLARADTTARIEQIDS